MFSADRAEDAARQWGVAGGDACDLLIIGGGVMGLWAALKAGKAGLRVVLAERGEVGQGASNGLLGALMPYMPDRWDMKKQFQFDALIRLEDELSGLEAETGLASGYRRSGRIIPLPRPHLRKIALRHEQDALASWRIDGRQFEWRVCDVSPVDNWPSSEGIEGGFVLDTMAAKVSPRGAMGVLRRSIETLPNVALREGCEIGGVDGSAREAVTKAGERIAFGDCIIAAGHQAFPMFKTLSPATEGPLGIPVKGQSALLKAQVDPSHPVIFLDGLYIVPHEDGTVAIGSTSEDNFDAPFSTDEQLESLIERAGDLIPALAGAPVVERWAGLRPKPLKRDPMIGPHPDFPHLHALAGGFKITYGIAHFCADHALGNILGAPLEGLPESFKFASHLR
jgi:glycine oxidase